MSRLQPKILGNPVIPMARTPFLKCILHVEIKLEKPKAHIIQLILLYARILVQIKISKSAKIPGIGMTSFTLCYLCMSFEREKAMFYQFLSFWLIWKLICTRILAQSNISYNLCALGNSISFILLHF